MAIVSFVDCIFVLVPHLIGEHSNRSEKFLKLFSHKINPLYGML